MVLVGSCTLPGSRYGELNQDHVELLELFTAQEVASKKLEQCHMVLVMDGHGLLGEKCAVKAAKAVAKHLGTGPLRKTPLAQLPDAALQSLMEEAFSAGHTASLELYHDPPKTYVYPKGSPAAEKYALTMHDKMPMYRSKRLQGDRLLEFGTTCTVALLQGRSLVVANAGDSGAVMGSLKGSECSYQMLTTRHWGGNEEEVRRVLAQHSAHIAFLGEDGYLSIEEGRWRGYQLSMTRALGHKMLAQYGVIFNPSVHRYALKDDDFCMVVASDGVWDVFEEGEVVAMVAEYAAEGLNASRIATRIVRDAIKLAVESPGCDADNTTCAVLLL